MDGEQALDLATGTGKVALALAAQAPGAEVLGLDLSSGMLNEARAKAAAPGLANSRFVQGSFDDMEFGPRFNVVTCSFGLFFVEDMVAVLTRFGRQAMPSERIVLSTSAAVAMRSFSSGCGPRAPGEACGGCASTHAARSAPRASASSLPCQVFGNAVVRSFDLVREMKHLVRRFVHEQLTQHGRIRRQRHCQLSGCFPSRLTVRASVPSQKVLLFV